MESISRVIRMQLVFNNFKHADWLIWLIAAGDVSLPSSFWLMNVRALICEKPVGLD